MKLRSMVNTLLRRRGLELRERSAHAKRYEVFLELLARRGFKPATVVDVGVNQGTPWLYQAFPEAKLVLIDANPGSTGSLRELQEQFGADVYNHAVGEHEAQAILMTDLVQPGSSSLLAVSEAVRTEWAKAGVDRTYAHVPVRVRTLDATLADKPYAAPFLIKIDTEGYEREVVLGARECLKRTDVVVAEVSVVKRFDASYEFAEFISLMNERDFALFDILEGKALGKGGPLSYIDAAFVRRGSPLSV